MSPGNSDTNNPAMGTIMQTASLSGGKRVAHYDSTHFTQSQKAMNASDFKILEGCNILSTDSKKTDSAMNSLVFKPRDSDAAMFAVHQGSLSLNSTKNNERMTNGSHKRKLSGEFVMHASHPSFGITGQTHQKSNSNLELKWNMMAEKCAYRAQAKELYIKLNHVNEIF